MSRLICRFDWYSLRSVSADSSPSRLPDRTLVMSSCGLPCRTPRTASAGTHTFTDLSTGVAVKLDRCNLVSILLESCKIVAAPVI